jgi:amino acid adenylation domain-containing protein
VRLRAERDRAEVTFTASAGANAAIQPTITDLVHARATACPSALAVGGLDRELTYRELDRWAMAIGAGLRARGAAADGPEDLVALLLPRSPQLAAGALGALYAGSAYLPLDPEHPADRIAWTLRDAGCSAVITNPELADRVPAGPWPVTVLDRTPPAGAAAGPVPAYPPDRVAYVIYTSGSTGRPKGVQVTHGNLVNLCRWHAGAFAVTHRDRAALFSSPAFDASVWELWPYLAAGASVHVPDDDARPDPSRLRDWLLATGVTICFLPTALAELMATLEWPAGLPLRVLLTGADTLHRRPPAGLPFRFVNNYGPTECAVVATSGDVPPDDGGRPPSIGRPIGGVTVRILDEGLAPVPPGAPGELCIGGAGVARGYLGRPALTAERYVPDPGGRGVRLYRSGDRAALRADGELAFLGRTDDQVKIRGFRVEPDEIAAVLARHPDVLRAAVTTWEPVEHDLRLAAYLVPPPGRRPAPAALRAYLEAHLPAHMVPSAFVVLDALPLTAGGKVDRAALPPPDRQAPERDRAGEPGSPVEERVAALVAELLGLPAVGAGEDFFLLGGHSLLGAQLITRVRDAYGVELTLQGLFDNPTIGAMAVEIERLVVERIESLSDDEVEQLLA